MQNRFSSFSEILPLFTACNLSDACDKVITNLIPLMRKFPNLVNDDDYDDIIDEWRALPFFIMMRVFQKTQWSFGLR